MCFFSYYNNMYEGFFYLYRHTVLPYEVRLQNKLNNSSSKYFHFQLLWISIFIGPSYLPAMCAIRKRHLHMRSRSEIWRWRFCRRQMSSHWRIQRWRHHAFSHVHQRWRHAWNASVQPIRRCWFESDSSDRFHRFDCFECFLAQCICCSVQLRPRKVARYTHDAIISNNKTSIIFTTETCYSLSGLCGVFDGDVSNDLTMPDGSVFNGNGSEEREQPREFIEAWRWQEVLLHIASTFPAIVTINCFQSSGRWRHIRGRGGGRGAWGDWSLLFVQPPSVTGHAVHVWRRRTRWNLRCRHERRTHWRHRLHGEDE